MTMKDVTIDVEFPSGIWRPNRIKQYRPAFFSGFETATVEFRTVDELLAIDFVRGFAEEPGCHQFSLSDVPGYGTTLMAEFNGGANWRVVGFLDHPVDLPVWDKVRGKALKAAAEAEEP